MVISDHTGAKCSQLCRFPCLWRHGGDELGSRKAASWRNIPILLTDLWSVLGFAHGSDCNVPVRYLVRNCSGGYFAYRLLSSARAEERKRREMGQPHTARDTALLLLGALSVVGVLLGAIFLTPLNALVHYRAGLYAIIVVVGGGLTYLFNRRRAPRL